MNLQLASIRARMPKKNGRPRVFPAGSIVAGAAIVSLALATAACGNSSGSGGSGNSSGGGSAPGVTSTSITIGNIYAVTGPVAPTMTLYAAGFDAYIAKINAQGGVYGRKIVVDDADDAASPTTALSNAQSLLDQKHIFAAAAVSTELSSFSPLYHQNDVPVLGVPYGDVPAWQNNWPNMVDILGYPSKDPNIGPNAWGAFMLSQGVTKVAVISGNWSTAMTSANSEIAALKAHGVKVVYNNDTIPQTQDGNFGGVVSAAQSAGAQGVITNLTPAGGQAVLAGMQQAGWKPKVVFPGYIPVTDYSNPQIAALTKGAWTILEFGGSPTADTPAAAQFRATIEKYGHESAFITSQFGTGTGTLGYDLAYAVVQGLQAAGKNPTRVSYLAALRSVHNFSAGGMLGTSVNLGDMSLSSPADYAGPPYCVWFTQFNGTQYVAQAKPFCGGLAG
jgi:ABC-type branched-subunit amino acid transport system substrate-binding protein